MQVTTENHFALRRKEVVDIRLTNTAVWNLLSNLLQQLRVSQPCVHMALSYRVYKGSRENVPLME